MQHEAERSQNEVSCRTGTAESPAGTQREGEHIESAIVVPPKRSRPPCVRVSLHGAHRAVDIAVTDVAEGAAAAVALAGERHARARLRAVAAATAAPRLRVAIEAAAGADDAAIGEALAAVGDEAVRDARAR